MRVMPWPLIWPRIEASVPRMMRWSGQDARCTTIAGQSAPHTGSSSRTTWARLLIERWIASVAPVAANAVRDSPCGIFEARTAVRVSTTDWAIPGRVSSWPSAAAAAAKAGTPGVTW